MKLSANSIIITSVFLAMTITGLLRNYKDMQGVIWSDTEGYYMYLPAVFIQHSIHHVPERSMDCRRNDKGELMMKYTCGIAYFYSPFFFAAHAAAILFHKKQTGFSGIYYGAMIVCGAFWGCVGISLLRRLLQRYFSPRSTWITLACIVLGTNFFHYSTKQMAMSHIYSFVLVAALLLITDEYYRRPARKLVFILSLLLGWLILIRPTNCVILLPMLLLNTASVRDITERLRLLKARLKDIVPAIPLMLVPAIPQLLYWKAMTGKWVIYSYAGEGFIYWRHPKITAVLFDPLNGLFLYSPILLLLLPAIILYGRRKETNALATVSTFCIITYLFASWWAWYFGAAFGHRCYVEYLPLFALPMAAMIDGLLRQRSVALRIASLLLMGTMIYYSVTMSLLDDYDHVTKQWEWVKWEQLVRKAVTLDFSTSSLNG
jgi:hypothetical protein